MWGGPTGIRSVAVFLSVLSCQFGSSTMLLSFNRQRRVSAPGAALQRAVSASVDWPLAVASYHLTSDPRHVFIDNLRQFVLRDAEIGGHTVDEPRHRPFDQVERQRDRLRGHPRRVGGANVATGGTLCLLLKPSGLQFETAQQFRFESEVEGFAGSHETRAACEGAAGRLRRQPSRQLLLRDLQPDADLPPLLHQCATVDLSSGDVPPDLPRAMPRLRANSATVTVFSFFPHVFFFPAERHFGLNRVSP